MTAEERRAVGVVVRRADTAMPAERARRREVAGMGRAFGSSDLRAPDGTDASFGSGDPSPTVKGRGDAVSGRLSDGATLSTSTYPGEIRCGGVLEASGSKRGLPPRWWRRQDPSAGAIHARGAVIRATQETANLPLIDPLPSYGRGRELPGGRQRPSGRIHRRWEEVADQAEVSKPRVLNQSAT